MTHSFSVKYPGLSARGLCLASAAIHPSEDAALASLTDTSWKPEGSQNDAILALSNENAATKPPIGFMKECQTWFDHEHFT
jgi:hypothetical protein